jgi:glycosyltransferase involved in cell wall biosynthesis
MRHARRFERIYTRWVAPRVRSYEVEAAARFDRCVVVSPADAEHLKRVSPSARVSVIPSGVDTEYFFPSNEIPEEAGSITLIGSFEWPPKQQSLLSLLKEVFPRIAAKVTGVRLYVVGKGVPEKLKRLAEATPGVILVGRVDDVRPYIQRSSILINYLESGGGIPLKVLEAMAMRKPVLSNSMGCEGIEATNGKDILIGDGPEGFAKAAAHLLENESLRRHLANNAYRNVMERYSWIVIVDQFQELYQSLLDERATERSRLEELHRQT